MRIERIVTNNIVQKTGMVAAKCPSNINQSINQSQSSFLPMNPMNNMKQYRDPVQEQPMLININVGISSFTFNHGLLYLKVEEGVGASVHSPATVYQIDRIEEFNMPNRTRHVDRQILIKHLKTCRSSDSYQASVSGAYAVRYATVRRHVDKKSYQISSFV